MIYSLDELILDTKDYLFEPFAHKGLGGTRKYIAVAKSKTLPKLIIKHSGEFAPSCNSFVYSRLAQMLGVSVPKAYLMNVARKDKHLFDSPSIVGIEYIDGFQTVDKDAIRNNEQLKKALIDCFTLFALFTRFGDNMQCAYVPNDTIYPFDFDESFGLENGLFNVIVRGDRTAEICVKTTLERASTNKLDSYMNVSIKMAAEAIGEGDVKKIYPHYLSLLQRFCELTDKEIESVTDAIMEIFSPLLAVYYEKYIEILQELARRHILKMKQSI